MAFLVCVCIATTAVWISYNIYADTMDAHYYELASNLASTSAHVIEDEEIETLTNEVMAIYRSFCQDGQAPDFDNFTEAEAEAYYGAFAQVQSSPAYVSLFQTLSDIKESNNILWSYICYMDEQTGKAVYIIDADTPENANPSGYCDDIEPDNLALMQQGEYDFPAYITNYDEYGWLVSASSGIVNEEGTIIANAYVDISMNDVMADRATFLHQLGLMILLATMVMVIAIYYLVRRSVVKPINLLASATSNFLSDKENVDGQSAISALEIRTSDEIGMLTQSVQEMEREINTYISDLTTVTAEKERIGAELGVAAKIQAAMLPNIFPAFPERHDMDIYATMTPAKEVGGDFYDFFFIDDVHLAMVMADVSGKGVPAALFMVIAKTLLKNSAQAGLSPQSILERVNNQLCENNEAEMFVTVWIGILNIKTGELDCANGGHERPAVAKKDGSFTLYHDQHGLVLGGMEDMPYTQYQLKLVPGDRLFLYTDGVTEATNVHEALFGEERMVQSLNRHRHKSLEEQLHGLQADIDGFVGQAPQFDDITMMAFELKGELKATPSAGYHMKLPPTTQALSDILDITEDMCENNGIPVGIAMGLNIAVDEIFTNIVNYSGATEAEVLCTVEGGLVSLIFIDNGKAYNPLLQTDPDITLSAEQREEGGLGIFMARKSMDDMIYEYKNGKNVLTLKKNWNPPQYLE